MSKTISRKVDTFFLNTIYEKEGVKNTKIYMQYEPPKLSVFVTQFCVTIPPGTKYGIIHCFTIWDFMFFLKNNYLKYQTHQFYFHLGFLRLIIIAPSKNSTRGALSGV